MGLGARVRALAGGVHELLLAQLQAHAQASHALMIRPRLRLIPRLIEGGGVGVRGRARVGVRDGEQGKG